LLDAPASRISTELFGDDVRSQNGDHVTMFLPMIFASWIGIVNLYSYGIIMALGFIAGNIVVTRECERKNLSADFASSLVVWGECLASLAGEFMTSWTTCTSIASIQRV
jgi:hypothetical protein